MTTIIRAHRILALATGVCLFIAAGLILSGGPPKPQLPPEPIGSDGYLTHISTDKPIYRTGEKVYVRGVILRADGHTPAAVGAYRTVVFEIKGPKGDIVATGVSSVADSVVGVGWQIPDSQSGGEYTVRISHPYTGDAPAERKFDIRAYRAPRLKSQIVFVRDGYGPGDMVAATMHVDRAEGGTPSGAKVSAIARVDGEDVWKGETRIDALGNASASFKLPAAITRGEGTLAMVIQDGGTVETASKTIPILLQTLDLSIYPEGGDLIADLMNRVYLEGRTPTQKPADIAGVIVNRAGREVAAFRTEHEGRGRFSFVPARGETYSLRVTEPAGITKVFPLPEVKRSGVVITSTSDITSKGQDVAVRVAATTDGTYGVALTQRGKEVGFKSIALKAGRPSEVTFTVPRTLDGVLVATVYDDEQKIPMAERLLFRQPEHSLKVQVTADRTDYVPGDKVKLRVTTTDDRGKPVGAVVGLTVTDSSVLEMIDKREQTGRLPVMVLLESEVKNLADAHVYLDETNPKAPLATDLLLGTQGWRRFAMVDARKFLTAHGDAARRVLAIHSSPGTVVFRNLPDYSVVEVPGIAVAEWPTAGVESAIIGIVHDPSGAVIPGVTVTATAVNTRVVTTVLTNEAGAFRFVNLPPSRYTLSASLPGFRTSTLTDIQLRPDTSYRYDFNLFVASLASRVEVRVQADAILAASAASVGRVLPQGQVRDLPLVGNNVLELMKGELAAKQINPDLVGEIRLDLAPVDAERAQAKKVLGVADAIAPSSVIVIREYAHALRPNWTEGSRSDFAETVYWNAGIKTDAATGIANVSFNLSDSVTSFRVLADGFSNDGTLGSSVSHVESVQPFFIEPKMPLQVTSGDVIQLPIGVVNGVSTDLRGTKITARATPGLTFSLPGDSWTLRAKERARRFLRVDIGGNFKGLADLTLDASAGPYRETVSRKVEIQPLGFPYLISSAGMLEAKGSRTFEFTLPSEIVRGSLSTNIMVYPTPLASMTEALQSLIREPYGCFEQTSSTSYPMVMAQQYFLTHTGVDPALIEKTRGLLDSSYKKLRGFETRSNGYEWFGAAPGHEALTAYGLMQFVDMSQVRSVDKEMLDRTRGWLLSRRNGKGGFNLNPKALDSFGGAPVDTTNAYIVWALVEAGEKGLEKEIAAVKASAEAAQDSYIVALAANILHASGDSAGARQLLDKLAKAQDATGNVKGSVTSITRSGGEALAIETTALSVLAWMRDPAYAASAEKSLRWIVEANKNGRFGSTQSTILALRSIVAYDAAHARPKAPGKVRLILDGKSIGEPVAFTANTQGSIVLPEFAGELGPGKHTLVLRMEDGSRMPFSMSVKYHSTLPDSAEQAQVGIRVALRDHQIQEGAVTEAIVSIENKADHVIPTPVAIVGIPGGLEVRHDQLKELVKSGKIDAYEVMGREVVLYWRSLKAKDAFDLPLSVVAAVPGTYTGPASRAYLYYTDEYKNWAPGVNVSIAAR